MTLATLISVVSTLLLITMGIAFLFISRTPGWRKARLFAVIALSGAAYSAMNVIFSLNWISFETVKLAATANFFNASVHISAWLLYIFANDSPGKPLLRDLPNPVKVLILISLGLGMSGLVPGSLFRIEEHVLSIPWLGGFLFRQPITTPWGNFVGMWLLGMLLIPYVSFIRGIFRGETGSRTRTVGFTFFFLCAAMEVLTASNVVEVPFLGDAGFIAISLTLLVESVRKVMADGQRLSAVSAELRRILEDRTRERDDAREALFHSDRLAAVGQLAASVGHEINNPLTYVRANVEYIRDAVAENTIPADTTHIFAEILDGVERIRRVVADLRSYALPISSPPESLHVENVLERAITLSLHKQLPAVELERSFEPTEPVHADAVRLAQVFINLLSNAAQALTESTATPRRIVVSTRMLEVDQLVVEIADNGIGMPPEVLSRLSEPYFSTRLDRGGSGLGLFVVRAILATIDGSLQFSSESGKGTIARVILPTKTGTPSTPPSRRASQTRIDRPSTPLERSDSQKQRHLRILIVDDDPSVARAISRMLVGHQVTIAGSGQDAMAILASGLRYDAMLCDVIMPGLSGKEVYATVAEQYSWMLPRLIFVTGGANIPEVARFLQHEGVHHITKPIDQARLMELIEKAASASDSVPPEPGRIRQ